MWKQPFETLVKIHEESIKHLQLEELNSWYSIERKELSASDLSQLMQWKLKRGKFRPTLMNLISKNDNSISLKITSSVYLKLNELRVNIKSNLDEKEIDSLINIPIIQNCIKELCELSGVGVATASAICMNMSSKVPFLSDESFSYYFPDEKIKYNMNQFIEYCQRIYNECESANKQQQDRVWQPRMMENYIWAYMRNEKGRNVKNEKQKKVIKEKERKEEESESKSNKRTKLK